MDGGVVETDSFHELFGDRVAERLAERRCVVGIQVVEDDVDVLRGAVSGKINNPFVLVGEVLFCPSIGDRTFPIAAFGFNGDEEIRGAVPSVFIIPSIVPCRCHWLCGTGIRMEFLVLFIHTEDRFLSVVGVCVEREHILHALDEALIHPWYAPHFFPATA